MNNELKEAGFTDLEEPETEREAPKEAIALEEVRQLLIPFDAEVPKQLSDVCFTASDLCELGHVIYDAEIRGIKVYFIRMANDVALVGLQYPTMFRMKAAVVSAMPGVEYHPRFNQAVFGCPSVSWGYIVDSLGLDDKLRFDTQADVGTVRHDLDEEEPDAAESGY